MLPASTIFESWLPMDSEDRKKSNCNVRRLPNKRHCQGIVEPGSVASALQPLRMARKLDPYRETAQIALEPWLVEAALARLDRRLSPADQRTIMRATRTPHRVRWPDWWSEHS